MSLTPISLLLAHRGVEAGDPVTTLLQAYLDAAEALIQRRCGITLIASGTPTGVQVLIDDDLRLAAVLVAGHMHEHREGGPGIPREVLDLLAPYRRWDAEPEDVEA